MDQDKQDWLHLLHLIASHRPAHLQHDYTTSLLQVGDVMPVQAFPNMWEAATMITIGKYKQGDVWMKRQGDVPCLELCCKEKYKVTDGYLPACSAHQAFTSSSRICVPGAQAIDQERSRPVPRR